MAVFQAGVPRVVELKLCRGRGKGMSKPCKRIMRPGMRKGTWRKVVRGSEFGRSIYRANIKGRICRVGGGGVCVCV